MGRYPRAVRNARIKCITCNAPVVRTVDDAFCCVGCGASPVQLDGAPTDGNASD